MDAPSKHTQEKTMAIPVTALCGASHAMFNVALAGDVARVRQGRGASAVAAE